MKKTHRSFLLFILILAATTLGDFIQFEWIEPSALATPLRPTSLKKDLSEKKSEKTYDLQVSLFGQPCLLQGPFETATLKIIHEISPEQIPAVFSYRSPETLSLLKKTRAKLTSPTKTPPAFDNYRDHLMKRIEAQIAFAEGLRAAKKNHKLSLFITAIQPHVLEHNQKTFETLSKKLLENKQLSLSSDQAETIDSIDQLGQSYNDLIESNPEEDFHAAARKLKIKYNCSFDETADENKDSLNSTEDTSEIVPKLKEISPTKNQ